MKNKKLIFIFIILLLLVLFAGTVIRPNLLSTNIAMADSGTVFNVPSERYKITRTNQYPTSQNYYNDFNQKFIKYHIKNLKFSGSNIFYFESLSKIAGLAGKVMQIEGYKNFYSYTITIVEGIVDGSGRYFYRFDISNFTAVDEITFTPSEDLDFLRFVFFTYDVKELIDYKNLYRIHIYGKFSFDLEIEYNNQYFYNKLFGVNIMRTFGDSDDVWAKYDMQITSSLSFYDNDNNCFVGDSNTGSYLNCSYILNNQYSYVNSYITKIHYNDNTGNGYYYLGSIDNFHCEDYLCYTYYFDFHDGNDTPFLYSGNSDGQDGLSSTLIPSGSNTFYKSAPWYDIPAQLYNLLIYIVFDAPLVSNITQAVYSVIQLFVGTFKFLISLFASVNNVFFITAIVGFLVLRFITAKILGGS